MSQLWMEFVQQPWLLALSIIIGTYILEDAAIVTAALLSADGLIAPELAFIALFIGIFTGDVGLYALGFMFRKWPVLIRWMNAEKIDQASSWLNQRMTVTILLVRIVPGLRLPTYTACGFLRLSLIRFCVLVFIASLIWTAMLFFGFYLFGDMFWSELSHWKWLLLPLIILLIMYGHRKLTVSKGIYGRSGNH